MNGVNNDNDNDNDNANIRAEENGNDTKNDGQNNATIITAEQQQQEDQQIMVADKTTAEAVITTTTNDNEINGDETAEDHNSVMFVDDDNISNISDSLPHQTTTTASHHPDDALVVGTSTPSPTSAHKRTTLISNGGDQYSIGGGVSSNVSTTAHTTSSPISSSASSPRRLSPLGIVVKKCSKELQAKPPLSEKRSILILQSLLGVLETKESTVISPSYSSNSSHSMHGGGGSSNRNLMMSTAEEQEQASVASHRKYSKLVAIENGALEAIVHTMKLYADSAKLQSKAVLLIKAIGDDYPQYIGQCYAVSYVSAVLTHSKHMKSDSLVYDALSSLVVICGCDDYDDMFEQPPSADTLRNLSQLIHGDGIRVLRHIMKLHLKREAIQQCLLQLLCHIANYDTYTTEGGGGNGGVVVVAGTATATAAPPASPTRTTTSGNASVRSNPSVGNVSRRSTGTGTVAGSSIGLFSPTTAAIEDPDLIELLVHVMSKHKRHCYIQQFAVTLLYLLATKGSSRTKSSLVWANAHLSILKAMSIHTLVSDIQYEGSEALLRMALERPEARSSIAEEGSATLLEAMKTHPNHSPINQSACSLLALLCGHPTTSKYIAKAINKQPHYRSVLSWAQAGHRSDTNCDELVGTILKSYDDHGD